MKLNRKWLMVVALVLSLAMVTGGTLAFLTDRDTEVNVFTVGNVDIEIEEDYDQDSPLNPGVEVDKLAGIKNVHATEPAYVWMTVSVPEALADYVELGWASGTPTRETLVNTSIHEGYVSYLVKHPTALEAGASTPNYLESVTLSEKVDYQNGAYVVVEGGEIKATIGSLDDVKIIVDGFAIQTEGFENVDDAYTAYTNQWGGLNGGISTGNPVESDEELLAALKNGTAEDLVYTGSEPVVIEEDLQLAGTSKIDLSGAKLQFKNGAKIIADNGVNLTIEDAVIAGDNGDAILEVAGGSTLTLGKGTKIENAESADNLINAYSYVSEPSKIVIDGAEITGNNNGGEGFLFNVGYNSELVIEDGTKISGNTSTGKGNVSYGLFRISGGNVIMKGGEISDNDFAEYALIWIDSNGSFTMNGGKITGNEGTKTGGALFFMAGGTIEINGGEISGNTADYTIFKRNGTVTVAEGVTVEGVVQQ